MNGAGARKRWPCVASPAAMPSTENGTISGSSVSGPKVATMECSGRTQVSRPAPQRIDFGHGNVFTTSGTISPITSIAGPALLLDHRDVEVALLVRLHLGLVDRGEPRGLQESLDRARGRADARALLLLLHVGLPRRHALHREREAARRGEGLGAFIDEAGGDQPVGDEFLQILGRRAPACARGFPRRKARAGGRASRSPE